MENNNDNSKFRLVEKKKKKVSIISIIVAVLLLIVLVVVGFFVVLPVSPSEWFGIKSAEMKSGEFPCDLSQYGAVMNVDVCNECYIVTTESAIVDVNSHGSIINSFANSFTNCVVKCSDNRFIAFDRKGTGYRVFNALGELHNATTTTGIVTASIADDGTFAILTDDNKVSVFNSDFKQIYRFTSAESLVDISVNGESGSLVVAGVTTKDGEFSTIIQAYRFNSEEPLYKTEVKGIAYKLVQDGGTTIIVSDTCCRTLSSSGEVSNELDYGSRVLSAFKHRSGKLLLVLSAGSNSQSYTVYVLNSSLSEKANVTCDKVGSAFDFSSSKVYVLSDKLYAYDYNGTLSDSYDLPSDSSKFAINKGDIAVISYDKLDLIK